jgi:protein phosphatase inhibitor 2
LSPEERNRRKKFEQKRKMHYNEFDAVKMARQLMEQVTIRDEC